MDLLETNAVKEGAKFALSPRIERLRARALDGGVPKFGWLRAYFYLEGWMAGDGESLPIRGAKALAHVIERMPVSMIPGEILVGEHGGDGDLLNFRASFPPDYAEWIAGSDLDDEKKRRFLEWVKADPFRVSRRTRLIRKVYRLLVFE